MFQISKCVAFSFLIFICFLSSAQDGIQYQSPPKDIADLVLARPTPSVSFDGKAEWMILLERSDFPLIWELAQAELRIGGLRINPTNFSPSRAGTSEAIQLKNIKSNKLFDITGLPKELKITNVQWSPDESKFALIIHGPKALDLYVVDIANRKARKVNTAPLNTVLGGTYQWAGNQMLVYKTIVLGKNVTAMPAAPAGPI